MTGAPQTYQRIHSCVAMEPPPKDCEAGVTLLKITTAQRSSGIELGINSTPIHFNMGYDMNMIQEGKKGQVNLVLPIQQYYQYSFKSLLDTHRGSLQLPTR